MSQNVNGNDEFRTVVLESDKPVLVDFWAEWCGPCRAVGPIVDAIGEENKGLLTVKVDIESAENAELAVKYGIASIPAMRVFVGGEIKKSITGAKPKPALLADLAEFLD